MWSFSWLGQKEKDRQTLKKRNSTKQEKSRKYSHVILGTA